MVRSHVGADFLPAAAMGEGNMGEKQIKTQTPAIKFPCLITVLSSRQETLLCKKQAHRVSMAMPQGKLKSSLSLTGGVFPVACHHQQGLAESVQQRGPRRRAGSTLNKHLPCLNSGQHTDGPADLGSDLGSQDLATAILHLSDGIIYTHLP